MKAKQLKHCFSNVEQIKQLAELTTHLLRVRYGAGDMKLPPQSG